MVVVRLLTSPVYTQAPTDPAATHLANLAILAIMKISKPFIYGMPFVTCRRRYNNGLRQYDINPPASCRLNL